MLERCDGGKVNPILHHTPRFTSFGARNSKKEAKTTRVLFYYLPPYVQYYSSRPSIGEMYHRKYNQGSADIY